MKVLFWSKVPFARAQTLDALATLDGVEVRMVETLEDCLAEVGDAELLVTGDAPTGEAAQVLAAMTAGRTSSIHFISAGRDGFQAAGIPDEIAVTGPVGANAATVAEHAVALTLALGRQVPAIAAATRQREWAKRLITGLRSLEGATVLIVGLGYTGRAYATRVRAFGSTTIGIQRTPRPDASVDQIRRLDELDELLPSADVVVITIALSDETTQLIDGRRLALMKPGAILVNVARGGIVDTDALAEALDSGRLAGAALDVTEPEPLPADHPLWGAPNVLISPHFAGGGSPMSMRRVGQSAADRALAIQEEAKGRV